MEEKPLEAGARGGRTWPHTWGCLELQALGVKTASGAGMALLIP